MKTMKVFDPYDMPRELNEALQEFGSDCYGLPNDCYFRWSVRDDDDDDGGGYISKENVQKINEWLIANGAEKGESVLIERSW